jgi:hypothetical protein
MIHPRLRGSAGAALLALLAACAKDATHSTVPTDPPAEAPRPVGVYQIAVTGIGTGQPTSSITASREAGGPRAALTNAGSGLVFEQVSSSSFSEGTRTAGGQRYVSFTYRVRNGTGASLNNLTVLMVQRANTIAGTPISSLKRFDGTDAASSVATKIVPTGAVALGSDLITMRALYPDVLQVLQESEVSAITLPAGVTDILPYGYMVRNVNNESGTRLLPAATSANQYDGLLTVSFRVPLQATAAQDVFSLFFEILAVQDSETRLTESIEEAQDTSAVRRLRERAASLGATTVTILPGGTTAASDVGDYTGQRQICSVRTAGTAASPVTFITSPGAYSRIEMMRPGESASACGANFRSGTATTPTIGSPYSITLKAMDRYGNLLNTMVDTVTVSRVSGPAASIGGAVALVSGQGSVNVTYSAAGSSVLQATGRRLRSQRAVPVPGSATVVVNAGDNQAAMAGAAVPVKPSVLVRDLGGNPLSGVTVTFAVTGGGGSVTGGTAVTNGSGIATVGNWFMGTPGALNTMTATVATASSPASFRGSGCSNGSGTGYVVTLCYTTSMTAPQRAAFDSAAAKWGRVITGDLANVSGSVPEGDCSATSPSFNLTIDDLLIIAAVESIDGPGNVLGQAGPCYVRNTNGLSVVGVMEFDVADMAEMEGDGTLPGVILHEMGHVLGIGTLWEDFDLLQNPTVSTPLDTYFSGSGGIAGFNSIGGSTYTGGNKVPVENTGGEGTANGHWRESVLANELMTGYVDVGSMPLSLLTVRSLADMGYTVNTAAADPFFLTLSVRQNPGRSRLLKNDVRTGPIYRIDTQGRKTRHR